MALTDKLSAIADAIRAKTGKTDGLTLEQMPAEITSITGGGSAEGCVTVTFMNGDTELFSRPVYIGDDCPNPVDQNRIDTPTKESTVQYHYTFYGWGASDGGGADSNILKNITEDKTVYAVYSSVVRSYTITYYDSDGATVLKTEQVAYGSVPSYTPTKAGDTFEKWNPTPVAVTGDASYVAKWAGEISGTLNDGAVTWSIANNVLTFRGTGEIPNQSRKYDASVGRIVSTAPWYQHRSKFTSVVIGEGITRIGDYFLYDGYGDYANVVSVSFPSTLVGEAFGESCFVGCTGIANDIVIPEGVTKVQNLPEFASSVLVLPQSLNEISNCHKWKNLKTITIPANVTYMSNAFNGSGLTSATFENPNGWTVQQINHENYPINSVTIPDAGTAAKYLTTTYGTYIWRRT